MRFVFASLVFVLLTVACGSRRIEPATYSLGRWDTSRRDVFFDRVLHALGSLGYPAEATDVLHGRIEVRARFRAGRQHGRFVVQLYEEGWILVTPHGPGADGRAAMLEEYAQLAVHLRERLGDEGRVR